MTVFILVLSCGCMQAKVYSAERIGNVCWSLRPNNNTSGHLRREMKRACNSRCRLQSLMFLFDELLLSFLRSAVQQSSSFVLLFYFLSDSFSSLLAVHRGGRCVL